MSIVDNIKAAIKLAQQINNLDLYRQLVGAEQRATEISKENEELRRKLASRSKLTFRAPFWYAEGEDIGYCPRCFDKNDEAIRVVQESERRFACPECQRVYVIGGKGPTIANRDAVLARPSVVDRAHAYFD